MPPVANLHLWRIDTPGDIAIDDQLAIALKHKLTAIDVLKLHGTCSAIVDVGRAAKIRLRQFGAVFIDGLSDVYIHRPEPGQRGGRSDIEDELDFVGTFCEARTGGVFGQSLHPDERARGGCQRTTAVNQLDLRCWRLLIGAWSPVTEPSH